MPNYRQTSKTNWLAILSAVLTVLLAVSIVLGVGFNLGWFDKSDDVDDVEQTQEQTEDNGVTEDDGTATQNADGDSTDDVVYIYVE